MAKPSQSFVCASAGVAFAAAMVLAQAGLGAPAATKGSPSRAPEEIRIVEPRKDDDLRKDG